ncbi:MAG: hypothetical protein Q6363_008210 [Candidatus Njordarchaeota archaeon]
MMVNNPKYRKEVCTYIDLLSRLGKALCDLDRIIRSYVGIEDGWFIDDNDRKKLKEIAKVFVGAYTFFMQNCAFFGKHGENMRAEKKPTDKKFLDMVVNVIKKLYDYVEIESVDPDELVVLFRSESPVDLIKLIYHLDLLYRQTGFLLVCMEAGPIIEVEDNKATAFVEVFLQFEVQKNE